MYFNSVYTALLLLKPLSDLLIINSQRSLWTPMTSPSLALCERNEEKHYMTSRVY